MSNRPRSSTRFVQAASGVALLLSLAIPVPAEDGTTILFIGNSFTFGAGTAVHHYRPETVTDLNHEGVGGIPALFKAFTEEAHLQYAVSLETAGGKGLDYHLEKKADVLARPWDVVCMHGYSTLDEKHPGDPALLVGSAGQMARLLHDRHAEARLYLTATWARADQIYTAKGHWAGKDVKTMTADIRTAYDQAAAACPLITGIIPVGEAWCRAIEQGVADPNPYDGIEDGKVDLWGKDHYHASVHGYYLEALTIFAVVTGLDPDVLGAQERVAADLGITPDQAAVLRRIAREQVGHSRGR